MWNAEILYPTIVAGFVAGVLTYCDLDAVFDNPPHGLRWRAWLKLSAWWWGFILANSSIAGFLYCAVREKEFLKGMDSWVAGLLTGASYTAMVRLKFTTLPDKSALGTEALYEALRKLVHKRINRIIREWRMQESAALAAQNDIAFLRQRALNMICTDAILTDAERNTTIAWIEQVTNDGGNPELDRRRLLAIYLVTERKP